MKVVMHKTVLWTYNKIEKKAQKILSYLKIFTKYYGFFLHIVYVYAYKSSKRAGTVN